MDLNQRMARSRRVLLIQGALAAVMLNLGEGNFFTGYLSWLGASPALIAQLLMIPYLGCVLQFVTPLFFEKRKRRKPAIIAFCFLFRFLMGFTIFAPLLFAGSANRLRFVFVLYTISFLLAGFVTPALNEWIMQLGPEKNRGKYYSAKEIIALVASSLAAFLMGRLLDGQIRAGFPLKGYAVIYGFCIAGALVDLVLMLLEEEVPAAPVKNYSVRNLLEPVTDAVFRPVLVYEVLSYIGMMFSSGFLSYYELNVLGLSHTFITSVSMVTAVLGILFIWIWGVVSDRSYWTATVLGTRLISTVVLIGWFLCPAAHARIVAPVLLILNTAGVQASGAAGLGLMYDLSPDHGKTAYLGVTAALGSLTGYIAALLGSKLQEWLAGSMGDRSIAVLFAISAGISAANLIYGAVRLPKRSPGRKAAKVLAGEEGRRNLISREHR